MGKVYSAKQIADMIGVTAQTIIDWEKKSWIPQSARIGLKRKRIWGEFKLQQILDFASDNGYPIPDRIFEQVRSS